MINELNIRIGARIRALRSNQRLSRERLSEKCDLSTQFLADIEAGRKSMTTTSLYKVSRALAVSSDYLLFGDCDQKNISVLMSKLSVLCSEDIPLVERLIDVLIDAKKLK